MEKRQPSGPIAAVAIVCAHLGHPAPSCTPAGQGCGSRLGRTQVLAQHPLPLTAGTAARNRLAGLPACNMQRNRTQPRSWQALPQHTAGCLAVAQMWQPPCASSMYMQLCPPAIHDIICPWHMQLHHPCSTGGYLSSMHPHTGFTCAGRHVPRASACPPAAWHGTSAA